MEKINFSALIKKPRNEQETPKNDQEKVKTRALPEHIPTMPENYENNNILNIKDNNDFARVARVARLKNEGGGIIKGEPPAPEGVATRKLRAVNLHPIAVCLLMSVAKKIHIVNEEIFHELTRLRTLTPIDQVKAWARYAVENGIDPHEIIYPFIDSPGKGHDCMTCQHLDMTSTRQPGSGRKLYQWQCRKQHPILEAYYLRERVLIAPVECTDYQKLSTR
ncbi:hypothetical protein [Nitrosomonas sp.]|uniref:hypothetical protein n=1 Tax=Nitrosomonas sp. TaxID=42353 RepID=UPI00208C6EBC|nr:hypothetical protein [Nitrosomonas sp.]GJL76081.1 MAG: hypothetical protein NMNS02_21870 [Nitrosomonas sp.]